MGVWTFLFFISSVAWAAPGGGLVILNSNTQKYQPADPASTSLRSFVLLVQDFKIKVEGEDNYGTRAFAAFETDKVGDLNDFGFVQFIHGCKFESCAQGDGSVSTAIDQVVTSFGEQVPFKYPEWVIDSDDTDPLYNSPDDPGMQRLGLYRWNDVAGSFEPRSEHYLKDKAPTQPRLYVSDRFGWAYTDPNRKCANNVSMEFRMCVYRQADIPTKCTRDDTEFAKPVACLNWASSYIYDFAQGKFTKSTELAPICR
jgi:hypothetical protein